MMKKRFLLMITLILGIAAVVYPQNYVFKPGSPSRVVLKLYEIYKNRNFREAVHITTGKEKENINKIITAMSNNFGRLPKNLEEFISKIDDIKFLDETIKDNVARVDVIWILKYKPKDSVNQVIKVNEVAYLLEKIDKEWIIRSSKQLNQHMLYNMQQVQEIYKKANEKEKK